VEKIDVKVNAWETLQNQIQQNYSIIHQNEKALNRESGRALIESFGGRLEPFGCFAPLVHPEMTVEALIPILDRTEPYSMPDGWQSWPGCRRSSSRVDATVYSPHALLSGRLRRPRHRYLRGRRSLFPGRVCLRSHASIPRSSITYSILASGSSRMDDQMRSIASTLGAVCIDAEKLKADCPARILNGWELKPYALLHCPFPEVLLLDADNVPVVDPTYLLSCRSLGAAVRCFGPTLSDCLEIGRFGRYATSSIETNRN
jgi:hypothetical protein